MGLIAIFGGERGIRTLDTLLTYTHFPGVLFQPLRHLSVFIQTNYLALCASRGNACEGYIKISRMTSFAFTITALLHKFRFKYGIFARLRIAFVIPNSPCQNQPQITRIGHLKYLGTQLPG